MDIYQIWTTYNKKWSKYEILAFSVLLLLTVIVVAGCVCRKKINIIQAMAIVTMVIFLGIVFGSTVFTRTSTIRQYELIPFWSWKAIFKYKDWELLKENLLNCILLLPAGALLPIIANHKRYKVSPIRFSRPESLANQGIFRAYCVTGARLFLMRSAACLRVIRFRQTGQYLTLLEVDAKNAPHSVHFFLSPVW